MTSETKSQIQTGYQPNTIHYCHELPFSFTERWPVERQTRCLRTQIISVVDVRVFYWKHEENHEHLWVAYGPAQIKKRNLHTSSRKPPYV